MSTCERMGPLVSAYIDGEISPQDAAEIERHLAQCAECSRMAADFRAAAEAAQGILEPGDETWDRVWSRIESQVSTPAARPSIIEVIWRRAFWVAAAAALAIAFYVLAPGGRQVRHTVAGRHADFEIVSIEVASADYTPVLMTTDGGDLPVIWVEKI